MVRAFSVLVIACLASGCGGGSSSSSGFPVAGVGNSGAVNIEVIHASQDAPNVNVNVAGSQVITDLAFTEVGYATVVAGTFPVTVEGIIPGGNADVIGPADLTASDGQRMTIVAANSVASIEPLVFIDDQPDVASTDVRVRVLHASAPAGLVDVYVTDPATDISTVAPLGTVDFRGSLGPVTVPEGTYRIQVTVAGDPLTVAFDSGDIALAGGSDLTVTAVTTTLNGPALVELLASTGSERLRLLDVRTPANVRVVHASPGAPDVDIVANDDFVTRPVTGLTYGDFTGFLALAAGPINFKVVPTGVDTPVYINADLDLERGVSYSVLATDFPASISPLVVVDDLRPVATESRVRIIHGSPSAGDVDIYVTASGVSLDDVSPTFAAVPFLAETGYVALTPGQYDVSVTPAGDKMPAIGPVTIDVAGGGVYTAIARDGIGATLPLGLILLDDFAP